jgi:hypothetical protein
MAYNSAPFRPNATDPDTIPVDLNNANNNFTILGQCFVNNDPTTAKANDSDKIDGIDSTQLARVDTIPTFTGGRAASTGGKINLVKPLTTNLLSDIAIDSYNSSNSSFRVSATNSQSQVSGCQVNFENFSKIYDVCLVDSNITETVSTATESALNTVLNKYKYVALPSNTTLTINLPAGVLNLTAPFTFPQLGGNTVVLNGVAPTSYNMTGVGSITGSAGNWSVPITLSNATGISVGDYVCIADNIGGSSGNYFWISGCWKVASVAGNTVTVTHTGRSSVPAFTLTGGTLWKFNTVLKQTTSGSNGVILSNLHDISLNNVAIVTDNGNGIGLQISNCPKVNISKVGINNFNTNLDMGLGTSKVYLLGFLACCGSPSSNGINLWGGNNCIECTEIVTINAYLITSGNYSTGLYAKYFTGSGIKIISCGNGSYGFYGWMSNVFFDYAIIQNNVSIDIQAMYQSRFVLMSSNANEILSPAVNTWGNLNSYIAY